MASSVDIANLALGMLGAGTITSLTDQGKAARTINVSFATVRDSELRAHRWKFAITRTTLPALSAPPASGPYTQAFQLPADFLKELDIGDSFPGLDLSDYRSGYSGADYQVENHMILTNLAAPLSLRYIYQVTDTSRFDSSFTFAFAAQLAYVNCEALTSSAQKQTLAMNRYKDAIRAAIRANALETPPQQSADAEWVMARIQ